MKTSIITFFALMVSTVNIAQNIYTIAGNGTGSSQGDGIPALSTGIAPHGQVAIDAAGNYYIADNTCRIRKVNAVTGIISTVAGTGTPGYNGDGIPATSAQIYYTYAVALDSAGNIYIGDYSNFRIRKVDAVTGLISTIAGTGGYGFNGDSIPAISATITEVFGLAVDHAGNVYFSDFGNNRVRKINVSSGLITTVAGTGTQGYNGDNILATNADLNKPYGIALDDSANVYIADKENNRIRKVSSATGIITTVAGSGIYDTYNGDGIPAVTAKFRYPTSVAIDDSSNIYISDQLNGLIYKVYKSTGLIYTVAGVMTGGQTTDGIPALSAKLNHPDGVNIDPCNNIYITLPSNNIIRKVLAYDISVNINNVSCYDMCDGSVSITPFGNNPPYTYSWSNGLDTNSSQLNLCANTYYISVTDGIGCVESLPVTITQPGELIIHVTGTNTTCHADGSAHVSVSSGYFPCTYHWSTGDSLTTINGLIVGTYYVTVTDGLGCSVSSSVTIGNSSVSFSSVPLCMVTVDSLSQNNIVFWNNSPGNNIDSFIVYREINTNNYQPIGQVSTNFESYFIDTVRTLYFPNTGNPNSGTFRYKLKTKDTCGNFSTFSPYHNTIYILNNGSGIFYWTQPYSIENGPNPVSNYVLMRDDLSNGIWHDVASVAGTQQTISDPLYALFENTASWRVKTEWSINCSPVYKTITNLNYSLSNIYSNNLVSANEMRHNSTINLYPNPVDDKLTVTLLQSDFRDDGIVSVYDVQGRLLMEHPVLNEKTEIDFSIFGKGIYILKYNTNSLSVIRKIVKK